MNGGALTMDVLLKHSKGSLLNSPTFFVIIVGVFGIMRESQS